MNRNFCKGKIILVGVLLALSEAAFGYFEVRGKEQIVETYGNAQTRSFRRAIEGTPMTPLEEAELIAVIPERDVERLYVRVRANSSTLAINSVINRSKYALRNAGVGRKRAARNQYGLEMAIGWVSSLSTRWDLEYLANRNLIYTASPGLFSQAGAGQLGFIPPNTFNSEIKSNSVLLNGYYEFGGVERFKPYITAGVGVSDISTKTTGNLVVNTANPSGPPLNVTTGPNTVRQVRTAWQLGVGFRLGFFTGWYLDASYRFLHLGNMVRMMPNTNYQLNGQFDMNAISVGVIYVF